MNESILALHNDNPRQASSEAKYDVLRDGEARRLTISELIATFPPILLNYLAAEAQTCTCCQEPFENTQNYEDQPCVKICGHVIGKQCLRTWLPHNSCPICRNPLLNVPHQSSGLTDEDSGEDSEVEQLLLHTTEREAREIFDDASRWARERLLRDRQMLQNEERNHSTERGVSILADDTLLWARERRVRDSDREAYSRINAYTRQL